MIDKLLGISGLAACLIACESASKTLLILAVILGLAGILALILKGGNEND